MIVISKLFLFCQKIGVVTSPSGAVIRDIITTVSRRFPGVEILLFLPRFKVKELHRKLLKIFKKPIKEMT